MEWISVKDALPDDDLFVCMKLNREKDKSSYYAVGYFRVTREQWLDQDFMDIKVYGNKVCLWKSLEDA